MVVRGWAGRACGDHWCGRGLRHSFALRKTGAMCCVWRDPRLNAAMIELSVSTWRQPMPSPAGPARASVLTRVVDMINALGEGRLRVAIDGLTAAGKTSFGHELARELASRGRPVFRASLDDFKRPWSERHLYDRESGEGYYRNAFDSDAACQLLLEPSGPTADGIVALCSIDPLTQVDHSASKLAMPTNGILLVDGVFANRPEINHYWDLRVWLEIDAELSVRRGTERDTEIEGGSRRAQALHRDRYLVGEMLYINEVDPCAFVDVIIDNTRFDEPRLIRPAL